MVVGASVSTVHVTRERHGVVVKISRLRRVLILGAYLVGSTETYVSCRAAYDRATASVSSAELRRTVHTATGE